MLYNEGGREKRAKGLWLVQLYAGNVLNMLYISCCLTVSPLSHAISLLKATLQNPSLCMCFPCAKSLSPIGLSCVAGPYHLHMRHLGKSQPQITTSLQHSFFINWLNSPLGSRLLSHKLKGELCLAIFCRSSQIIILLPSVNLFFEIIQLLIFNYFINLVC